LQNSIVVGIDLVPVQLQMEINALTHNDTQKDAFTEVNVGQHCEIRSENFKSIKEFAKKKF
jgi:hypothetical protein